LNVAGVYGYHFNTDLIEFLKTDECPLKEYQVETIHFEQNIEIFQHYTSVFVVLNNEKTRQTKKMYELGKRKTLKA